MARLDASAPVLVLTLVAACGAAETPGESGSLDPAQAARRDVELQRHIIDGVVRAAPDCLRMEAILLQHHAAYGAERVRLRRQHAAGRVYEDARRNASRELIEPILPELIAATRGCQGDDFLTAMELLTDPSGRRRCHTDPVELEREPPAGSPPEPADERPPRVISGRALEALRIRGNKNILPDEEDRRAMADSGRGTVAVAMMCLGQDGRVARLWLKRSSCFPRYDAKLKAEIRAWRYRPFRIDGAPVPVCTRVSIIYRPILGSRVMRRPEGPARR